MTTLNAKVFLKDGIPQSPDKMFSYVSSEGVVQTRCITAARKEGTFWSLNSSSSLFFNLKLSAFSKVLLRIKMPQTMGPNKFGLNINGRLFVANQTFTGYQDHIEGVYDASQYLVEGENIIQLNSLNMNLDEISIEVTTNDMETRPTDHQTLKTCFAVNENVVYERYDTSDAFTSAQLLKELQQFKTKSQPVPTSTGTSQKPINVKVGFVFCDFKDVEGENMERDFRKLIGFNNEFIDFVTSESKGKVSVTVDLYRHPSGKDGWIKLDRNYSDYAGKDKELIAEVDTKVEFPDEWQVVFFAFPDKYTGEIGPFYVDSKNNLIKNSYCSNGQFVDLDNGKEKQMVSMIFLDPRVYRETRPESVTIHEFGHALGLIDIYDQFAQRSYAWSLMSACGPGWHFTGFEKLVLGWEPLDNFIFLKSGTFKGELNALAAEKGIKGVIVLPQDNSTNNDWYFMEISQETGATTAIKNTFTNYGLLVMVASPQLKNGVINPFVAARNLDKALTEKYWQAYLAPYKKGQSFLTNGIRGEVLEDYIPASKTVKVSIECLASKPSIDRAIALRENEKLTTGKSTFFLTITGFLSLNDAPVINNGAIVNFTAFKDKEYGFCAFVDKNGIFNIATATNSNAPTDQILKSFPAPSTVTLEQSDYFFKLEEVDGKPRVNIYEGKPDDPSASLKYQLFDKAEGYTYDWAAVKDEYKVLLQNDGNLMLLKGGAYIWGTKTSKPLKDSSIGFISIDDKGVMTWYNKDLTVLKRFDWTGGQAPFSLELNTDDTANIALEVKDKNLVSQYLVSLNDGMTVSTQYNYNWRLTKDNDEVFLQEDGNLMLLNNKNYVWGTKSHGPLVGKSIRIIRLDDRGTMVWVDTQSAVLRKFEGVGGKPPFSLHLNSTNKNNISLEVRDKDGVSKYLVSLANSLAVSTQYQQDWLLLQGDYNALLQNGGNLMIRQGQTYLAGTKSAGPLTEKIIKLISIDDKGSMTWLDNELSVLKTFEGVGGKAPFYLDLDTSNRNQIAFQVRDRDGVSKYRVLPNTEVKYGDVYPQDWSRIKDGYKVLLQNDGNLMIMEGEKYIWGTKSTGPLTGKVIKLISIDDQGSMTWLDNDLAVLKKFEGVGGKAPFYLDLDTSDKRQIAVQVRDNNGVSKYRIYLDAEVKHGDMYGYNWNMVKEGYKIFLQNDGNLMVLEDEKYLWGTKSSGPLVGKSIKSILLDDQGSMTWLDNDLAVLKKFEGVGGTAPFYLDLNITDKKNIALDVKDNKGVSKYQVSLNDEMKVSKTS